MFFVFALFLYCLLASCISMTIKAVVNNAFNNMDYNGVIGIVIDEENYDLIKPIQPELEEGLIVKKLSWNSFPVVLPFFTDAYYIYIYLVFDTDTNENIYSLTGIATVKYDFNDFRFRISDIEIAP